MTLQMSRLTDAALRYGPDPKILNGVYVQMRARIARRGIVVLAVYMHSLTSAAAHL